MEGILNQVFVDDRSSPRPAPSPPHAASDAARSIGAIDPAIDPMGPSTRDTDASSVARAREGDAAAFAQLHARFAPLVHAIALANGARSEADDVEQEVFLAAWRALPGLRSDEHFGGWLAQITRHRAQRHAIAARSKHRPNALDRDVVAFDSGSSDASTSEDVLQVLTTLPEAYRETLALRLIEGQTGPEIAALTGLTHGSVRVNLTRGMEMLRQALRERGWT